MSARLKWLVFVSFLIGYPLFILVVAGFWQAAAPEKAVPCPGNSTQCCLDRFNTFEARLYYTLSICTTLGFGRIYPCTPESKAGTFFLLLIGLPYTAFEVIGITYLLYRLTVWLISRYCEKPLTRSPDVEVASGPEKDILFIDAEAKQQSVEDVVAATKPSGFWNRCHRFQKIELIGFTLFIVIFLLLAVYFAASERVGLGDALFYAFFAVFSGDFRINAFKPAILLFVLTLLAIISLFLTIALYARQLFKAVGRIQRVLERAAKDMVDSKRKVGLEKFEEIYGDAVDKNVSCLTRRIVKPVMHDYFRHEFGQRLRSLQEIANVHAHYHGLLSQSAESLRPGVTVEESTSMTGVRIRLTLDTGTVTDPEKPKHTNQVETQTPEILKVDTITEARPVCQDFSSHFCPTVEERGDLASVDMEDTSLQTEFLGKNVSLQYPEPRPPTVTTAPAGRGAAQAGRGGARGSPAGAKRGTTPVKRR